jgi:dienelactone hydrolase
LAGRRLSRCTLGAVLAALALGPAAAATVEVPSLDAPQGSAIMLPAHWFPAAGATAAPAVVMLHGCGGLYGAKGRLAERYTELAARLNAWGVHALAPDSLRPRGEKELCTQREGARKITLTQRRRDALGALQWLAAQPGVDARRLALLGWSNGGSTVLAATNLNQREVRAAPVQPALAVAYYPGCQNELQRGYAAAAPLLLLLGEADDWTPAAPCKSLAATAGPQVEWQAFEGAVHGFDGTGVVRLRRDVPNGVNPGRGVHVGGDPAARQAAAERLEQFLRAQAFLPPAGRP